MVRRLGSAETRKGAAGSIFWPGPLLGVVSATLIFLFVGAGFKWTLLFLLVVGAAAILCFLALRGLTRPVLLMGLGFSFIINPRKSFGLLDLLNFGGVHGFFISLTDLTVFCLVVNLIADRARRQDLTKPPIALLLALGFYLFTMVLSLVNAANQILAVAQIFFEVRCILLFLIIGFWVSADREEALKFTTPILVGLAAGMVVETAIAAMEYLDCLPADFSFLGIQAGGYTEALGQFHTRRVGGTFRHPNYLAVPMAVLIPVNIAAFLAFKDGRRVLFGLALLGQITTLILTLSRSGLMAAVVATLIFIILILRNETGRRLLQRNLSVLLVLLVVLAIVTTFYSGSLAHKFFESDPVNIESRIELNRMAMGMIGTYPLAGVGINNHTFAGREFDGYAYYQAAFGLPPIVHNVYLLIASEIGLPGLMAFLFFLFLLFRQVRQGLLGNGNEAHVILLVGLAAGLTGYLIAELWGSSLRKVEIAYLFWWQAATVMLFSRLARSSQTQETIIEKASGR